jgi:fibronectin type 3 domain-containing protein/predicted small lipoprotein YifL
MKKSISTLLLSALIISFSGCGSKGFNLPSLEMPDLSIPSFDLSPKTTDRNLPRVQDVKVRNSLSQVALEWKPIRDRQIVGYRILRNDGKGSYQVIKIINDPYVSHYTDENKNQSVYNRYLISAYTNDGRVSLPSAVTLKTSVKKIAPVPFVTAISGLPNRVKILWRIHPDLRVNSYLIQRKDPKSNNWNSLATVEKRLSVEYIDNSALPGITYQYRVVGKTIDGVYSIPSKEVSGTAKLLPPPVTGIMATTNLPKKIEIIWKPSVVKDALYRIYASDFEDGVYSFIAGTKATHYTDRFDTDGTIRFYRVTVVDTDGLESTKQVKAAKGSTLGYLNAPNITSARVINSSVELQWTQTDPRTTSYTIYKKYWDGWRPKIIKTVGFTGTTYIDTKIKPNITYTYYVEGVDKSGIPSQPSRSVNLAIDSQPKTDSNSWF